MLGRVLDSSALTAWSLRSSAYIDAIVWSRAEHREYVVPLITTAAALTAAIAQLPDKAVPVLDALIGMDITIVDPLTSDSAPAVAEILRTVAPYAAAQAVTAVSVAHAARRRGLPIVTADPIPLRTLWPKAEIDHIP
ncbi:hypothetical protein [Nonomuraea sp. NPDC049504]|uniref:hypothetical protein n=1 Tax=Nonomuraea sp. NPDC049504 TaxID=3154729 RepID=UPI003418B9BE